MGGFGVEPPGGEGKRPEMTQPQKSKYFLDVADQYTVHRGGGCEYQGLLISWQCLGEFCSLDDAVTFAVKQKGYHAARPCPKC